MDSTHIYVKYRGLEIPIPIWIGSLRGVEVYRGPKEVPRDVWSPWLVKPCVAIQIWTDLSW
jgi:hypothetical protein